MIKKKSLKNNNEGFYTTSLVLIVLSISVLFISLSTGPMINTKKSIKRTILQQETSIKERNGYERLYSTLIEDPVIDKVISYDDLGISFNLTTLELELENGDFKKRVVEVVKSDEDIVKDDKKIVRKFEITSDLNSDIKVREIDW